MKRAHVGPARAFALAGILALVFPPASLVAQRRPAVRLVEITPADAQIQVGQAQVFLANAYDAANRPIDVAFSYTTSNPRVATVDANGIARGVGPGRAFIRAITGTGPAAKWQQATLEVVAATAAVTPQAAAPPTPAATPAPVQPQPVERPAPERPAPERPAPERPGAARPGAVRPSGPGYAAIDRQEQGSGQALGLVVNPRQANLVRGEYFALRYQALNESGELAERVPLLFEVDSAGRNILEVDSVGVVRAIRDTGATRVRIVVPVNANPNNIQPRVAEVIVRGDSVAFSRSELWLTLGSVDTLGLVVPAQRNRAFSAPPGHFQFESSDEAKVRVNPILPVITALAPGVARISGVGSAFYHPTVTVHVLPPVVGFRRTPAETTLTVAMRASVQVQAQPLAADSSVVADAKLQWTLPDTAVARFDTLTGALRGVGVGETRLVVAAPYSHDSLTRFTWQVRVIAGGLEASRTRVGVGVGDRTPVALRLLDDQRRPFGPATELRWTARPDSVARYADGNVLGVRPGRTLLTAHTTWDSTASIEVFSVGPLLASVRRGGRWDLYQLSADSAPRLFPVTADSVIEQEPAWSPDLTRIAYVAPSRDRIGSSELWVANADGSEARRITFDSSTIAAPVFVPPAGEQLVFQSNKGGRTQLYLVNRDGTGRRQITSGEAPSSAPAVSPDGRKLLFVSLRPAPGGGSRNYDVFEMNLDGTGERRLTTNTRTDDSPRYGPDGRSFYWLRDEGGNPNTKRVFRRSLSDTTEQGITATGLFVRNFSVSADGSQLVLAWLESGRRNELPRASLLNPATGALTPIVLPAGDQLSAPVFRPATPQPR